MDRSTQALRAAIIAGTITLVLGIVISLVYPLTLETLPEGFISPILAIEYLASMPDAERLFAGDLALIGRVQTGHYLDMLFLLAYGAFLALANGALWLHTRHWSAKVGVFAAMIAAVADACENLQLLALGQALLGEGGTPDFELLRLCMGGKFLAITVAMLCLGRNLFQQGVAGKLFCGISLILVPVAMLGLDGNPLLIETMALLIMIGWIILMVWLIKSRNGLTH